MARRPEGCTCTWVYTPTFAAVYLSAAGCPAGPHPRTFEEAADD